MRDAIAAKRSRRLVLVAVGLLAAVAVLPLLVPPSAVAWSRWFWRPRRSAPRRSVGRASAGRLSDPKAATALAVGPRPRFTDAPKRGLPWYEGTLKIRAKDGGKVRGPSVIVVPSAGLMFSRDKAVWVTLPSESRAAYAKLTAGLTPRPARTLPGLGRPAAGEGVAPASTGPSGPRARPPRRVTARTFGSSRWVAGC